MSETNPNSRLETFCDGVFAIALTLLIIDIKIPAESRFVNAGDFWMALKHIIPSASAFVLSFIIIFITWVNHHGALKILGKSSPAFIYANGLLLLSVVFLPFPTSLLGEYIFTGYAAPAVMLYCSTLSAQALSWILMGHAIQKKHLYINEKAIHVIRKNTIFAYAAFGLYSVFAITAFWFPLTVSIATMLTWLFWLAQGINMKHNSD